MSLSEEELDIIAKKLFERLIEHQNEFEKENHQYVIYDEFGNSQTVSESEFYHYELERLYELESKYVNNEEYEKADMIKNKILRIKLKLSKL